MDVDGLSVDRVFPVEPVFERYTLAGCAPFGALLARRPGLSGFIDVELGMCARSTSWAGDSACPDVS